MTEITGLAWGELGLLPAVAQDRLTGQVRMVAWVSREALAETLRSGRATFFSRSRQALWTKGAQSGNTLAVHTVWADCDADTLLYLVEPAGPSCHTGRPSCFFRTVGADGALTDRPGEAATFLEELEETVQARKRLGTAARSYTRSLLDAGPEHIGAKLREEADELARAVEGEAVERVVAEAADVLFHLMVALAARDVPWRRVLEALAARSGVSGHEEKAARDR
jgi:phosphoribosyl-AMP cyclohydrolase / phosphoribosyl-ATP pyrophosphohydrolase